jgi:hypothetical protein
VIFSSSNRVCKSHLKPCYLYGWESMRLSFRDYPSSPLPQRMSKWQIILRQSLLPLSTKWVSSFSFTNDDYYNFFPSFLFSRFQSLTNGNLVDKQIIVDTLWFIHNKFSHEKIWFWSQKFNSINLFSSLFYWIELKFVSFHSDQIRVLIFRDCTSSSTIFPDPTHARLW